MHIIHINNTLQICAYPNLHHNVHYTINDINKMKGIISKAHKYDIKVAYYSKNKNYTYNKDGDVIVTNKAFELENLITNEDMVEAKQAINGSTFDKKEG